VRCPTRKNRGAHPRWLQRQAGYPDTAAEAIREFRAERNRLNRERPAEAAIDYRAVETAERKIKELVTVIENAGYRPAMTARLTELEQQKCQGKRDSKICRKMFRTCTPTRTALDDPVTAREAGSQASE
jgi:hypothetical protein